MKTSDLVHVEAARRVPDTMDLDIELRMKRLSTEFGQKIVALVQTATLTVTDVASCQAAVNLRQTIGALQKEIEAGFEADKQYYYNKHKGVCAEEAALLSQLVNPKNLRDESTIDGKLVLAIQHWTDAEDRRKREEETRLAAQAKADAEARAAAEAATLESAGEHTLAAAVLEEAIAMPAPSVALPSVRSRVAGLKTRRAWRWRFSGGPTPKTQATILKETPSEVVTKVMKLLPREYLQPDVATITTLVEALGDKTRIPGVEVYVENVPVR
jgi:transposase-like protein